MLDFLIKRPIAVFTSFLVFLVLGIFSLNLLPVSLLPKVDVPTLKVITYEDNYSLQDLESYIATPLRRQLLQISGLKNLECETSDGKVEITMHFDPSNNVDISFLQVNEKIDQILSSFPKEITRPNVIKLNPTNIPLFYITIPYPNNIAKPEFSSYINQFVRKRLEQLKSVALVDISGMVLSEITIKPNLDKLYSLGIDLEDIQTTITKSNNNITSFSIKEGIYQFDLLYEPNLKDVDDIKSLLITKNNLELRIEEIAQVVITDRPSKGKYLYNYDESIKLAIIGSEKAQLQKLEKEIRETMNLLTGDIEIDFVIHEDQTKILNQAILGMRDSLFLAVILAFVIILIFVKKLKVALIIIMVVPTSLLITFFFIYISNMTINVISMSGLIMAVGMMVDNSIIVIENISQYKRKGIASIEACKKGTYEILRPLFASFLTTTAVFIPLIKINGIAGSLFFDQSITIVLGLFISYITSVILIPVLYHLLMKDVIRNYSNQHLFNLYERIFVRVIQNKFIFIVLTIALAIFGIISSNNISKKKLPSIGYNDIYLSIDWNESINLEESTNRYRSLIERLPENLIDEVNALIGKTDFLFVDGNLENVNQLEIYFKVKTTSELETLIRCISLIQKHKYPNSIFKFKNPKNVFELIFGSNREELIVKIPNQNMELVTLMNTEIKIKLENIKFSYPQKHKVVSILPIPDNLSKYDIDQGALLRKLRHLFGANEVSLLKTSNELVPIVIRNPAENLQMNLNNSFVENNNNKQIPIRKLIQIQFEDRFSRIYSDSESNYLPIIVDTDQIDLLIEIIKNEYDEFRFGGTYIEDKEFINDFLLILIIVVTLLYLILAAQFESLMQPIIILIEVPITIGITFLIIWILGLELNIMSLIGIIVSLGIIINDSILKIDTINRILNTNSKMTVKKAVLIAGERRLDAILMTSLTTVLAMMPILFSTGLGADLQKPFALLIILTVLVGTYISLYLVPLFYIILNSGNK